MADAFIMRIMCTNTYWYCVLGYTACTQQHERARARAVATGRTRRYSSTHRSQITYPGTTTRI
eukprot:6173628-Pleurochrysis_carterae.AAC.1